MKVYSDSNVFISDELIEIEVKKIKKSYFGALKGIGPFTHEDMLDSHD